MEEKPKSGCLKVLIILFVLLILLTCAALGASYYAFRKFESYLYTEAPEKIEQTLEEALTKSNFSAVEKEKILTPVRKLTNELKAGELGIEQVAGIGVALSRSNLMTVILIKMFDENYLQPSELTPEEKLKGKRTATRFARGIIERKIPEEDIKSILKPVTVESEAEGDGTKVTIKNNLSAAAFRQMLEQMEASANSYGLPDEDFELDIAKEIEVIIETGKQGIPN